MVTALVSAIYVDNEMQARRRLENTGEHAEMKVNGLADADAAAAAEPVQRSRQLVVNLGSYLADHALCEADGRRRRRGEMASVHSGRMSGDHSRLARRLAAVV